jgi:arginine/lysine/ornithine decarboxylase
MNTPIYDFLQSYSEREVLRLHMPGHKGKLYCHPLSAVFPYDITEIKGADSLYEADGIISESEKNAAKLFGSTRTLYSTQGSTLCIQTMLALAARPGSQVIAPRNAHKAFINSCILLDLDVVWIFPEGENRGIVSFTYSAADVEKAIISSKNPSCVYITSPDYYGRMADVAAISEVCKKYGLPLLVDNAHGAHLKFLEKSLHPMDLGADMCCDSAHKTLPVLTGGAYLHIKNERFASAAKDKMALFASTSPSYLTLCSLDLCNEYLENTAREHLEDAALRISKLKGMLAGKYEILETEPLHFALSGIPIGIDGHGLSERLRFCGIEPEYCDDAYAVLLFSPLNSKPEFEKVLSVLSEINPKDEKIKIESFIVPQPEKVLTPRQAALCESEEIPLEKSLDRICAAAKVKCPPGIPVVVPGERIDSSCMNILKKYSISTMNVVK